MALAHQVVVLSSCCAVAYLNPEEKTKRYSCSELYVSEAPKHALAFAAELDGIKFQGDMGKILGVQLFCPRYLLLAQIKFHQGDM